MENNTTVLEFELDSLRALKEDDDLALAEIDLLHLGVNRNMCNISKECVEASKESFYDKPIIYRYNNKLSSKFATDFEEHSRDGDPTMNIAGHIPYGTDIEYIERDGRVYVRVMCVIHKVYLPSLMNILKRKDGNTKISIEIVVLDGDKQENGVLDINKFKLRGVCLLGDEIVEGIAGSEMNVVKFSNAEYNDYYTKAKEFSHDYFSGWVYIPSRNGWSLNNHKVFAAQTITIDKSKEALSDSPWGDVDKTDLRDKVLSAANMKELVSAVYLLVESDWEDSPSTKLKYPVMEIKDGKAFYNRHALASALGYARAEGEQDVVDKVLEIYKNLDIDDERKENSFMENIENKLDKDNKDLEEIRDDAEAQEDDVKEEEKEQENALTEDAKEVLAEEVAEEIADKEEDEAERKRVEEIKEEIIENEIEPHDEGEEGLEDDVDADKDYWKKKAEENAAQLDEMNKRVMALEKEKEMACMEELLREYEICLDEEDRKEFAEKMKEMSAEQFSAQLYQHIAKCAKEEKLNNCDKNFAYMPSNVGSTGINSEITLETMSNKYSKK